VTHRVDDILDAAAALLSELVTPLGMKVFTHRRETLDADQDELPAYSIDAGEDVPSDGHLRGINSVLDVVFTAVVSEPFEPDVRKKLLDMRALVDTLLYDQQTHRGQQRLGLTFVYGIAYGGASAPETNSDGERCTGSLSSTWKVAYEMF
jgi:hypothetical protein